MERVTEFHAPDYFNELYNNAEMRYAFKGKSKDEFTAWQKEFRPKLMEKLGIIKIAQQLEGFVPTAEKLDSTVYHHVPEGGARALYLDNIPAWTR